VSKEVGEGEGAGGGTTPHPSVLRVIRIAAVMVTVLAAARPTLLFRPRPSL